ncbi:MAG: NAD-binding protein, partial [Planctomycetota bacterium]
FFLSWMAPRGIVAAAVASVFSLALIEEGIDEAKLIVPYVFLTIVVTVAVYGLSATLVAKRLGLADPANAGFLIAGASPAARMIGKAIQDEGVEVLMVDLNYSNIQQARFANLQTMMGNILSPQVHERIELTGIGRLLAMTPNNEVNSLAAVQFGRHWGRSNVFQLAAAKHKPRVKSEEGEAGPEPAPRQQAEARKRQEVGEELRGRALFGDHATFAHIERLIGRGAQVRKTKLSKEFTFKDWQETHKSDEEEAIPLLLVGELGNVSIFTQDANLTPRAGQSVIALTMLKPEAKKAAEDAPEGPAGGDAQSPGSIEPAPATA